MGDRSNLDMTVLVVEDLDAHTEYLTYLLKKRGFNVVKAENGEKALEILDDLEVACALVDINLGSGMSGLQLMHEIRKKAQYKDLPIISITAFYSREIKGDFIEQGFTDLMAKPFNYDQLNTALNKHLYLA